MCYDKIDVKDLSIDSPNCQIYIEGFILTCLPYKLFIYYNLTKLIQSKKRSDIVTFGQAGEAYLCSRERLRDTENKRGFFSLPRSRTLTTYILIP